MWSILLIRIIAHNHEGTLRGVCLINLLANWSLLPFLIITLQWQCRFPLIEFPRLGLCYLETGVPGWLFVSDIYTQSPDTTMTRPQTVAGGYWAPVMVMRYSISNLINNRNDFHDHELRQFAWSQVLTSHPLASFGNFKIKLPQEKIPFQQIDRIWPAMIHVSSAEIFILDYHQEHPSHLRSGHKQILTPYRKAPGECLIHSMRGTHGWHIPRWHLSPDADLWPHGN